LTGRRTVDDSAQDAYRGALGGSAVFERATNGPTTEEITRAQQAALRAAARILARHHRPDWRPGTDGELDAWGHGYNTGYNAAIGSNRPDGSR